MSSFKVVIQKKKKSGEKKKGAMAIFLFWTQYNSLPEAILMKTIQLIKTKTPISQEQKRNHTNSKHIYSLENV